MIKQITTLTDAAREWVRGFNAFSISMIEMFDPEFVNMCEITPPTRGDKVYISETNEEGEVIKVKYPESEEDTESEIVYVVSVEDSESETEIEREYSRSDLEITEERDYLPMWGTMWQFDENLDDWWLEELNGLQHMADCGFRIYEHDEFGYFFGIDGAGYNFYESHWIPLYKTRGLKWHED